MQTPSLSSVGYNLGMKKVVLFLLFIFLFIAVLSFLKKDNFFSKEPFLVEFSSDLLSSNLYSPDKLKIEEVNENSVQFCWNFVKQDLLVSEDDFPEYANLSGFRIYRDDFWFTDVDGDTNCYKDNYLLSGELYEYRVAALTFDNKIVGEKSNVLTVQTKNESSLLEKRLKVDTNKIATALVFGDSVTHWQRANPGDGWADQVGRFLKRSGVKNFNNLAEDGFDTHDVLQKISDRQDISQADIVFVGVGINDLIEENGTGGVSLKSFLDTYTQILDLINSDVYTFVVGITPARGKMEKVVVWNKALNGLAEAKEAIYIPTDYLDESYMVDDIHPNQNAHNKIADYIIDTLQNLDK